ncbi:hypothetical protein [Streptomyces candidus]|uniref:Uncharacterized protein n=1 Tax=Streptomyces candidus TaxID=67283 RepID=A0A7X0HL86_9ACTN|nr:hypothetical protein [Streptomyces candidus]MBB6439548.1 hypothetical protein [Streptomyces candidus]GHH54524.1 hypothetical protein GCM10018773_57610 [Streptomyces candidus]
MSDTTALDAAKIDIRRWTQQEPGARAGYGPSVLYVPSVLEEAAELLGKLYAAGQEHHIEREDWAAATSLPLGVLDVLVARYCSGVTLTSIALHAARDALTSALSAMQVTVQPGQRIAVAPLPGGPAWGSRGQSGLSLGLTRAGWDIAVDETASRPLPIAAPTTEEGAREVAGLVHKILRGEATDPFAAPLPKGASA